MDDFGILPTFDRKFAKESKFLRKTLNFSLGGHFMPKGGREDLAQRRTYGNPILW
jgi:hypothetical protein